MRRTFDKFFAVVDKIFEFLSFLTLGGMTLFITIQVICRYLLNSPLGWSEELARFGFIWMTFFAGYLGARRAQHISVELVQNLFPRQVKKGMKCVSSLITSAFFLMVVYYLLSLWGKLAAQTSAALNIPMNYIYFGMLLGSVFLGLSYLYDAVRIWLPDDKAPVPGEEVLPE